MHKWIETVGLQDNIEVILVAEQEQVPSTKPIQARAYYDRQDSRCRLWKDSTKIIQHIIAGCKIQAGTYL